MKKISYLLCIIVLIGTIASCEKDNTGTEDNGIEFANTQLEKLVRDALEKPAGNITDADLLTIDTLIAGIQLVSLNEVEKLKNLVFLNIVNNENIDDFDIEELKKVLTNCVVLHRKYVLTKGKYYLLKTIEISQTETSYPEYQYEIIMKGNSDDIIVEVNVYARSASLVESTIVSDTYSSSTTINDYSFHPYWSEINIKDVVTTDLKANSTTEVKINALSTGSFTLSFEGNTKVLYHTDKMAK